MFWRSVTGSRSLQCFYCHERTHIASKSRNSDWKCPNCDALNILDENGEIADEIPNEYQNNETTNKVYSVVQGKVPSLSTPFCSVCSSNQALLVKTLASYLPDDDHPDIDVYERALPAYRASLEERYPPVCSACAPNVQDRLQRNNYIAKSTALGNWLSRAKVQAVSDDSGLTLKLFRSLIWAARGFLWLSASLAMLLWFTIGAIAPATQKFGMRLQVARSEAAVHMMSSIHSHHLSQHFVAASYGLLRLWLPFTLLGAFWNPKGLSTIFHPTSKFSGKDEYVKLQSLIVGLRFITIYVLPLLDLDPDIHMRLSVLFLLLSSVHFVLSLNLLEVVPRTKVDLRDQSSSLTDTIPNLEFPESFNELPAYNEQPIPNAFSIPARIQHADESDEEAVNGQMDSMDWQPSPSQAKVVSTSPFTTTSTTSALPSMFPRPVFAQPRERYFSTNLAHQSSLSQFSKLNPMQKQADSQGEQAQLAQQKFFAPERPTGLENLFSAAVRLDDEPLLVKSIKSIKRVSNKSSILTLVCSVGLLPLQYFGIGRACVLLGTASMMSFGYSGLLMPRELILLALWPFLGFIQEADSEMLAYVHMTRVMWFCVVFTILGQISLVVRANLLKKPSRKSGQASRTRSRR